MSKTIIEKAANIFPEVQEILNIKDSRVCLKVTGDSMYPFLRHEIDSVELVHADFSTLKVLDIVLIKRKSGQYIMHRIKEKRNDCFYIVGDAQQWIEGPLYPNQLIALVNSIWRRNKKISCKSFWWVFLSYIWMKVLPFRGSLLKVYRKSKHILNKCFSTK